MYLFTLDTFKIFSLALDCPSLIMCFSLDFFKLIFFAICSPSWIGRVLSSAKFNVSVIIFWELFQPQFLSHLLEIWWYKCQVFHLSGSWSSVYFSVYFLCVTQIRKIILICLQVFWFYHLSSPVYNWTHSVSSCLFVCFGMGVISYWLVYFYTFYF